MSQNVEVKVTINPESHAKVISDLEEINSHAYVLIQLLKRSWLLRLIFGVNLKKLKIEVKP